MINKDWNKYQYFIRRLCYDGEKVIDSEVFRDLKYVIKDGHIILISKKSGNFSIELKVLPDLIAELEEMRSVWGDIKTNKCL